MVSKSTQILCFWGGSVYTCDLDKDGLFENCEDNNIQTEDEILKKQEQLRLEQERKQRLNQSFDSSTNSEPLKSITIEVKKD